MGDVNLIPGTRLAAKARKARLRLWGVLCGLYVIVLATGSLAAYVVCPGQQPGVTRQLALAEQQIAQDNNAVLELRRTLGGIAADLETARAIREQPDWSKLLAGLSRGLGEELVLSRCQLVILREDGKPPAEPWGEASLSRPLQVFLAEQRYRLVLRGFGRTQESVSRLVLALEGIGAFDQVRLVNSCRQTFLSGQAVAFTVECDL